jgi:hypothetical protein
MRKIEREHAAPQDRFTAFGMADACKFKFVNYLANIFRAGHSRTNASTRVRDTRHRWALAGTEGRPVVGAALVKEVHV